MYQRVAPTENYGNKNKNKTKMPEKKRKKKGGVRRGEGRINKTNTHKAFYRRKIPRHSTNCLHPLSRHSMHTMVETQRLSHKTFTFMAVALGQVVTLKFNSNNNDDNSGRSFYIAVFHCQG